MTVQQFGDDAWFITYPSFSLNPDNYLNPDSQMSYEFAIFLTRWNMGDFGPSEFHTRNFYIAQRKSCYSQPLMNQFGVFTAAGLSVLEKAKAYISLCRRYWQSLDAPMPGWHEAHSMDTILLAAPLMLRHVSYLKTLYNHENPETGVPTQFGARMPNELVYEFRTYNGREHLMTGILRPYPQRRKDFEVMVKYGLIGLEKLPKLPTNNGKGRAPIGAYLSEQGRKFYEDFRIRFDPQVILQAERNRTMSTD